MSESHEVPHNENADMSQGQVPHNDNAKMKDLEEVVLQQLCEEIIKAISPRIVGNQMVTKGLLLPEEFESLVTMRVLHRSPESDQNSYLLSCLVKRPAGSLTKFREILVESKAKKLEEMIASKLLNLSLGPNTEDFWKKEYKKLEIKMQQKDEELKILRSQVENAKLKDEEIRKLQVQLDGLTSCITMFHNKVKPYTLHGLPEKLSKVCHPDSQRSSIYKDSDSQCSCWYRDSESPRSSWSPNPAVSEITLSTIDKSAQHDDEDVSSSKTLTPGNNPIFCFNNNSDSLATHSGSHHLTSSRKTSNPKIIVSTMDQKSTSQQVENK